MEAIKSQMIMIKIRHFITASIFFLDSAFAVFFTRKLSGKKQHNTEKYAIGNDGDPVPEGGKLPVSFQI